MGEAANYKCPASGCGGRLESDGNDWFTCKKCGQRVHEIAATHPEILEKWADRDDLDSSEIANALLGRGK